MRHNPKPQEIYRHFKGNIYQICCLAKHSETGETMVVYQAMYGTFQVYVRPLSVFMSEVDRMKYAGIRQKYRFELIQDTESERAALPDDWSVPEGQRGEPFLKDTVSAEYPKTGRMGAAPEKQVQTAELEEQPQIDPLVLEFLDADTYEQRLNILAALRHRITDEMINTMAVAVDLEIKEGGVEERYEEFRNCLLTFEKYECNRLR